MRNWTLYLLLVFLAMTVLIQDSYGLTMTFSNSNSLIYGYTTTITVTPANSANITEISINNVIVANTITAGASATFNFNAFGPIPYLNTNAMVAGSPYTVNGISTNSIHLVALGDVANSVGNVITNSITIAQGHPPITFPSTDATVFSGTVPLCLPSWQALLLSW